VTVSVTSLLTGSLLALGLIGCGDTSDSTSTAATPAERSTTTQAQSPPGATDFFGASLTSATAGEPGVVVQSVRPDSKSQLKRGDVIVAFNGTPVASPDELVNAAGTPKVGDRFKIKVVRGSHRFTLVEVQSPTAYLGADVRDATGGAHGALVVRVAAHSPAAAAGLRHGDLITAIDRDPVRSVDDLLQVIATHSPGDEVRIAATRGSRQLEVTATLAERPTPGG
jgi:S1-C subfamily serine protease